MRVHSLNVVTWLMMNLACLVANLIAITDRVNELTRKDSSLTDFSNHNLSHEAVGELLSRGGQTPSPILITRNVPGAPQPF
jgi:hypothetical protein